MIKNLNIRKAEVTDTDSLICFNISIAYETDKNRAYRAESGMNSTHFPA